MVNKIENIDANDAFKKIGKKISDKRKSLRKKFPGISKKLNISVTFLKYIEEGKLDKIPDHIVEDPEKLIEWAQSSQNVKEALEKNK